MPTEGLGLTLVGCCMFWGISQKIWRKVLDRRSKRQAPGCPCPFLADSFSTSDGQVGQFEKSS